MNRNNGGTICEQKNNPQSMEVDMRAKAETLNFKINPILHPENWRNQLKIGLSKDSLNITTKENEPPSIG